jgi:hypothetical protein
MGAVCHLLGSGGLRLRDRSRFFRGTGPKGNHALAGGPGSNLAAGLGLQVASRRALKGRYSAARASGLGWRVRQINRSTERAARHIRGLLLGLGIRGSAKPPRWAGLAAFSLVVLVVLCFSPPLRAQSPTGTPPFGSFSGGPDVVNNANLDVHLSIPVVNKAGRGLPFYYLLTDDSFIWSPVTVNGNKPLFQPDCQHHPAGASQLRAVTPVRPELGDRDCRRRVGILAYRYRGKRPHCLPRRPRR